MIVQDKMLNQDISNIDLNSIAALQQKRTLAFVNHFVITTVQFLNNFAKQCEQKLMHFENKLEKINATMVLLETRLSSIPEVNSEPEPVQQETPPAEPQIEEPTTEKPEPEQDKPEATEEKPAVEVKPELMRFVKMVQVGVPLQAVKLKMSAEGFDPSELDKILPK